MRRTLISIVAVGIVASALGTAATSPRAEQAAPVATTRVTICHETGSETNPYRRITIARGALLGPTARAHVRHAGDLLLAGSVACPSEQLANPASASRITICHRTRSQTNPYRRLTVSMRAWLNSSAGAAARAHMRHTGDLAIVGAAPCPSEALGAAGARLAATLQPVATASGSGSFTATIRLGRGELCYTLNVTGLTNVTAAHIHRHPTAAIVVPLSTPTTGSSSGCVDVAQSLLREILQSPGTFYVNVHTMTFPDGQVQGDLRR